MLYLITGGERSGKSKYAQELALSLSPAPVYLATARIWDKDFESRVDRHKKERDNRWTSIEEEKLVHRHLSNQATIVLDCITLWLTNFFTDHKYDLHKSLLEAKEEIEKWKDFKGNLIVVTNEIGMGLHAESKMGRDFVSLQGWTNQSLAEIAENVSFMVSGIPLKIK